MLTHKDCGGEVDEHRICTVCGERINARNVKAHPGPGAAVTAVTSAA